MSNSYANKQAKYSRYVVKNLSNKQVRIFGINIKPGTEFDLLSIPGISQNEIFSSVLKDDIGPRLRSTPAILSVVENTIDLITITLPDADYTLDPVYFDFGTIIFAGTLTAQRNIVFPNYGSTDNNWIVKNNTNQFLNVKTSAGTGKLIQPNLSEVIFSDGANIQHISSTVDDANMVGGFRSVADITARNAIATQLRKEGMYVYVQSSNELYKLGLGLTNSDWLYAQDNKSVTNLTALAALNDTEYTERTEFLILTVEDFFYLNKTSTITEDGITIVNSLSSSAGTSPGRWIRRPSLSTRFLSQRTWYVDPQGLLGGNDENSGATSLLPLKTYAELNRRVWSQTGVGGRFFIQAMSASVSSDPPKFLANSGNPSTPSIPNSISTPNEVIFNGTYTTIATGTISAGTAASSSTNEVWSITDVTKTWSTYINGNYAIRITSGPASGCFLHIDKDMGAGRVLTTRPALYQYTQVSSSIITISVAITGGTTYDIVQFLSFPNPQLNDHGTQPSTSTTHIYQFFYINTTAVAFRIENGLFVTNFNQCIIDSGIYQFQSRVGLYASAALGHPTYRSQPWILNSIGAIGYTSSSLIKGTGRVLIQSDAKFYLNTSISNYGFDIDDSILVLQSGAIVFSVSGITCFTLSNQAQIKTQALGVELIGTSMNIIFNLVRSCVVNLFYADIVANRFSITCTSNVIIVDGFPYAIPQPQPFGAPVLQLITPLPAGIALNSLNIAPWALAAVSGESGAKIIVAGSDSLNRVTFS